MRVVLVGSAEERRRLREQLPDGIDVVAEETTMGIGAARSGAVDAFLVAADGSLEDAPPVERLTPRETQVLDLLAGGMSNRAMAARLGISEETVKFHLAAIFGKLGASNRTDAVRLALRRGLVSL
jgi:DNA-binding NarL/FixJ family response regulator